MAASSSMAASYRSTDEFKSTRGLTKVVGVEKKKDQPSTANRRLVLRGPKSHPVKAPAPEVFPLVVSRLITLKRPYLHYRTAVA